MMLFNTKNAKITSTFSFNARPFMQIEFFLSEKIAFCFYHSAV